MRFRFGEFEADTTRFLLYREGQAIPVDRKVFDLLAYFLERPGTLISRDDLLADVWDGIAVAPKAVNTALYELRRVLIDNPKRPRFVETVRGRGFRFVGEVQRVVERELVGRGAELRRLLDCAAAEGRGAARLALVTGEPGIGKSALLSAAAEQLQRAGVGVLFFRCPEVEGAPGLHLWMSLVRRSMGSSRPAKEAADSLPVLSTLLSGDRLEQGGVSEYEAYRALASYWASVTEIGPIAVFIDDLHRADDSSVAALKFLAADSPELERFIVIASSRDPVLVSRCGSAVVHSELGPLGAESGRQLVESLGVESAVRVEEVLRRAEGNPLFLTRLAEEARDSRAGRLPASLVDVLLAGYRRLDRRAQKCVRGAATIGRRADYKLLEFVAGGGGGEVSAAISDACDAGVLRAVDSGLEFTHVLVRDAVYSSCDPSEQRALHARAAEGLAQGLARGVTHGAGSLASHSLLAGDLLPVSVRVERTLAASSEAQGHYSFADAIRLAEEARDLVSQEAPALRFQVGLRLGELLVRGGRMEKARVVLGDAARLASELGSPDRFARVALAAAPGLLSLQVGVTDHFSVWLCQSALALDDLSADLRARLEALHSLLVRWEPSPAQRAVAAPIDGHLQQAADYLSVVGRASRWGPGAEPVPSDVLARLEGRREYEIAAMASILRLTRSVELAERNEVDKERARLLRYADVAGVAEARWYSQLYEACDRVESGRFDEATRLADEFRSIGSEFGGANVRNAFAVVNFLCAYHRGELKGLAEAIESVAVEYPGLRAWDAAALAVRAARGERLGIVRRSRAYLGAAVDRNPTWLCATSQLGDAAADVGDESLAEVIAELLTPYRDLVAPVGYGVASWGSVGRVIARLAICLGDPEQAKRALSDARRVESSGKLEVWGLYTDAAELEAARAFRWREPETIRAEVAELDAKLRARGLRSLRSRIADLAK